MNTRYIITATYPILDLDKRKTNLLSLFPRCESSNWIRGLANRSRWRRQRRDGFNDPNDPWNSRNVHNGDGVICEKKWAARRRKKRNIERQLIIALGSVIGWAFLNGSRYFIRCSWISQRPRKYAIRFTLASWTILRKDRRRYLADYKESNFSGRVSQNHRTLHFDSCVNYSSNLRSISKQGIFNRSLNGRCRTCEYR